VSSPREGLSPVPFVPYAVSLALSVEYRKMRHSRLPMFRLRAKDAFARDCDLLAMFGGFFWGARVVSGLGARVLREMERAAGAQALEELAGGRGAAAFGTAAASGEPNGSGSGSRNGHGHGPGGLNGDINGSGRESGSGSDGQDRLPTTAPMASMSGDRGLNADDSFFGNFNYHFDLTAVDLAIEANLDIATGQPLNWVDWESMFNPPAVGAG